MNLLDPVSTIMSHNLMTLRPTDSISAAADIFERYYLHHIPIMEGKELLGMVSKSDYLFFCRGFLDQEADQRLEEIRMNNYEVAYIMTSDPVTMDITEPVNTAIGIFQENLFRAIPVMSENEMVGLVTTYDVIVHLAKPVEVSMYEQ